jgi:DNA-binding transcriptional LysR family regulator
LTDIVAHRFDAGVRLGEQVAKDMISVRIGPDASMAVVGAPSYFEQHPIPRTPQDLADHRCINLRLSSAGGFYAWEFEKEGHELRVRVQGQLAFNNVSMVRTAARAGFGLACLLQNHVADDLAEGRLVRVLEDWCPPFPGYHLYYPSRRQTAPAFALLVEALRHRQ